MSIILPYKGILPTIDDTAFVASSAAVTGDVTIGAQSTAWFNAAIRGDVNTVRIGSRTNIQDGAVVHVSRYDGGETVIGDGITIGHLALIHACELQDDCFVGMKACVMDNAIVETGAMVAAGALVTPGKIIKSGELWMGSPARYVRPISDDERQEIAANAQNYVDLGQQYKSE